MDKFFKLKENGTNVKTEVIAGITTFLSMVYILAVNPSQLSAAGMDSGAVFTATAVSAIIATLCMAFFANYPVALAAGMGLNSYFAFTVVPEIAKIYPKPEEAWKVALTAILFEGLIFMLLSLFKFRETLVNKVPANLKYGITAGIGLFIVIIALKGAGIVVSNSATLVSMGDIGSAPFVLAILGFIIVAILHHFKVPGSIFIGILATWFMGMGAEAIGWYVPDPAASMYSVFPNFDNHSIIPAAPYLFEFDFSYIAKNTIHFLVVVFSFLYVDIFDTAGTLIGVASKGNLLDKDGNLPRAGGALMADAVGTVAGSCLGTSTVTSYVESSAGVAAGGRTGLTSVVTALLFGVALFFSPIFLAIPGFATAPALIFVGLLMMGSVTKMSFDGDIADTVGGFLAIIMMPFTYSIANGIMFGIIAWVILKVCTGKIKDVHPIMWISFVLFALRITTIIAFPGM